MSRPWRAGPPVRLGVALFLCVVLLGGVGALFGLRARAIARTAREIQALREEQNRLWAHIEELRAELARAADREVVEQKAREILRWAYPDEELVLLIRRR